MTPTVGRHGYFAAFGDLEHVEPTWVRSHDARNFRSSPTLPSCRSCRNRSCSCCCRDEQVVPLRLDNGCSAAHAMPPCRPVGPVPCPGWSGPAWPKSERPPTTNRIPFFQFIAKTPQREVTKRIYRPLNVRSVRIPVSEVPEGGAFARSDAKAPCGHG